MPGLAPLQVSGAAGGGLLQLPFGGLWGPLLVAALGGPPLSPTRTCGDPATSAPHSGTTRTAKGTTGCPQHTSSVASAEATTVSRTAPRPSSLSALQLMGWWFMSGHLCFLGNHSGVVLSINSREMHSYLVS